MSDKTGDNNLIEKRHGYGRLILYSLTGDLKAYDKDSFQILEGQWRDGNLDGYGRIINSDGNCYIGMFDNGKKSSDGKYFWANGDLYDGKWFNDRFHGEGTFYLETSKECFHANWNHGKIIDNPNEIQIIDRRGKPVPK
jgi:hypothetical protein